jgi:DNA-binding NarL/FixJ family response regulator
MIRILLADDHDLMREGIRSMLESHSNFEVCAEAKDGIEAAEKALEYRPDVVILDVTMPKMNGLEASRRITKQLPETQVLIFTIHDSEDMVRETLDAGAHGYVLKSEAPTHLAAAVEAGCAAGPVFLFGHIEFCDRFPGKLGRWNYRRLNSGNSLDGAGDRGLETSRSRQQQQRDRYHAFH